MKTIEQTYGYDDVAIVPGEITINPELVDTRIKIDNLELDIPIFASAMDSVVDPNFSKEISDLGGVGVINLDGIHVRYNDTEEIYNEIASASQENATELLQKIYSAPVKENLIGDIVKKIKNSNSRCFASFIPASTKRFAPVAVEAGCDSIVIQSTVTTARHNSKSLEGLILSKIVESINVPIIVGNTVTYNVSRELMETGIHGILVGVGPGSACTSREVLGVGVPQVSATLECSSARDDYFKLNPDDNDDKMYQYCFEVFRNKAARDNGDNPLSANFRMILEIDKSSFDAKLSDEENFKTQMYEHLKNYTIYFI